jgi:hypothetical protein
MEFVFEDSRSSLYSSGSASITRLTIFSETSKSLDIPSIGSPIANMDMILVVTISRSFSFLVTGGLRPFRFVRSFFFSVGADPLPSDPGRSLRSAPPSSG